MQVVSFVIPVPHKVDFLIEKLDYLMATQNLVDEAAYIKDLEGNLWKAQMVFAARWVPFLRLYNENLGVQVTFELNVPDEAPTTIKEGVEPVVEEIK